MLRSVVFGKNIDSRVDHFGLQVIGHVMSHDENLLLAVQLDLSAQATLRLVQFAKNSSVIKARNEYQFALWIHHWPTRLNSTGFLLDEIFAVRNVCLHTDR